MAANQPIHAHAAPQSSPVEYRDIPGFPGYRAGTDGTIWSAWEQQSVRGKSRGFKTVLTQTFKQLRPSVNSEGYLTVRLSVSGRPFTRTVHVLVLLSFVGECPTGMEGCHAPDNSRTNCSLSNLRWDTRSSNQRDRRANNTANIGEDNGRAKITIDDVKKIRNLAGSLSQTDIATRFGMSRSAVGHIIARRNWSNV